MAITYTYNDAASTVIKKVDDATTPDTISFIPVAAGNRDYAAYLIWVDDGGVTGAYVYPGYEDIATARTTRLAGAASELTSFVKDGAYTFNFFRSLADSTYTLPAGTQTKFADAYALYGTFETAINSEATIENVRLSTIDYEANSYNIPT